MAYPITKEEFAELLNSFEHSAFRLESLDKYTVSSETVEYARFLAGEELPVSVPSEWTKLVRKNVAAGKIMQRVHLIPAPLTPYLKYEIYWGYVHSSIAGEEIYLMNRVNAGPDLARMADFWLFDQRMLIFMRYDSDGRFVRPEKEDSAEVLATCREIRDSLVSTALPLKKFLANSRSS